jgi:hypothetical protein
MALNRYCCYPTHENSKSAEIRAKCDCLLRGSDPVPYPISPQILLLVTLINLSIDEHSRPITAFSMKLGPRASHYEVH